MNRLAVILAIGAALASGGCKRETRNLRPEPSRLAIYEDAARESELQPAGAQTQPFVAEPTKGNANDISEGQRLFGWYNCVGCHFHGGGGIGPPLIKTEWLYGDDPANLFATIVKGRPNGMPAWGGKIPEYQVWQIVAYVRSMNHKEPQSASAVRSDQLETNSGTLLGPKMEVKK